MANQRNLRPLTQLLRAEGVDPANSVSRMKKDPSAPRMHRLPGQGAGGTKYYVDLTEFEAWKPKLFAARKPGGNGQRPMLAQIKLLNERLARLTEIVEARLP